MISLAHPEKEQPTCESDACRSSAHNFASVSSAMLPAGSALVDTGAGHPTCGSLYFERIETELNKWGIKSVIIPVKRHPFQYVQKEFVESQVQNQSDLFL